MKRGAKTLPRRAAGDGWLYRLLADIRGEAPALTLSRGSTGHRENHRSPESEITRRSGKSAHRARRSRAAAR